MLTRTWFDALTARETDLSSGASEPVISVLQEADKEGCR